jgi:hypothetical protein
MTKPLLQPPPTSPPLQARRPHPTQRAEEGAYSDQSRDATCQLPLGELERLLREKIMGLSGGTVSAFWSLLW